MAVNGGLITILGKVLLPKVGMIAGGASLSIYRHHLVLKRVSGVMQPSSVWRAEVLVMPFVIALFGS